jgi:broad specificity phosphatase PhoE
VDNEGGTVVIVTHTVPIRATFWLFLGLPFHASYLDLEIAETGITEWMITGWLPGSGHPQARLVRHNDHRHLLDRAEIARPVRDRIAGPEDYAR